MAMGQLSFAHANLEMVQIMCLKTLERLQPDEALAKYRRKRAEKVRDKVKKLVSKRSLKTEEDRRKRVADLLFDARSLSDRRNALVHRFCGKDIHGRWRTSGDGNNWEDLPSIDVIRDLTKSIERTAKLLNDERFDDGFILALANRDARGDWSKSDIHAAAEEARRTARAGRR